MPANRHLRAVGERRLEAPGCRTSDCPFPPAGLRGYCTVCDAVYCAAVELRERLLERRGAHLRAARPALFDSLDPVARARLLAHVAAQSAHRGQHPTALALAGLEDFLQELRDLRLEGLT